MPRTVYYAAMSVDGFIASPDGKVDFLDSFHAADFGYGEFFARVGAVVLGRATFEQSLTFGAWPYSGRLGLVVTSRPIRDPPAQVRAVTAAELPAALEELRAAARGDVWIVGGGKTAQACLDAGLVDELELYLVPRLLGNGVPLLSGPAGLAPLRLAEARAFPNGVLKARYEVERHRSTAVGDSRTHPRSP
jgi:dihydrofolate reductase